MSRVRFSEVANDNSCRGYILAGKRFFYHNNTTVTVRMMEHTAFTMPYFRLLEDFRAGNGPFWLPFTAGLVAALLLAASLGRLYLFTRPRLRAYAVFRAGAALSVLVVALTLFAPFAPVSADTAVFAGSAVQFAGLLSFGFFFFLLLIKRCFVYWGLPRFLPFLLPPAGAVLLPLTGLCGAPLALGGFFLLFFLVCLGFLMLALIQGRYWHPFMWASVMYLLASLMFFFQPGVWSFLWAVSLFGYFILEYKLFTGEEAYGGRAAATPEAFAGMDGAAAGMNGAEAPNGAAVFEDVEELVGEEEGAELAQAMSVQGAIRLAPFVPQEFLSILNKESVDELKLGDHIRQEMTIFFSDIRQFTDLSEKLTPEESFAFINSYLSRIVPEITKNGGFVDKYIGDAILALFPQEDGADKAVQTAVSIQEKIREYNGHRANSGYPPLAIGIGIHTGPLMVGVVGVENRMQNTVISDAVNLTSRLESITKVFGVSLAISDETFKRLSDPGSYKYRFIGKVRVKGKSAPVSVFEIFDGIDPAVQERKIKANMFFEQGMFHYYKRNYAEALMNFRKVREVLPYDGASAFYMDNCLTKLKSL